MNAQQKQLVDRVLSIWNGGDAATFKDILADNCTLHHYRYPGPMHGRQAFENHIRDMRQAFPDLSVKLDDVFAEQNKIVVKWSWTGTHRGKLGDLQPTGKRVHQDGVDIIHLDKNNRIEETYCIADALMLLKQLEAVPASVHI